MSLASIGVAERSTCDSTQDNRWIRETKTAKESSNYRGRQIQNREKPINVFIVPIDFDTGANLGRNNNLCEVAQVNRSNPFKELLEKEPHTVVIIIHEAT